MRRLGLLATALLMGLSGVASAQQTAPVLEVGAQADRGQGAQSEGAGQLRQGGRRHPRRPSASAATARPWPRTSSTSRTSPGMLKGGKRGPALVPGKADESLLFRMAAHRVEPVMPPKDKKEQTPLTPRGARPAQALDRRGAKDDSAEQRTTRGQAEADRARRAAARRPADRRRGHDGRRHARRRRAGERRPGLRRRLGPGDRHPRRPQGHHPVAPVQPRRQPAGGRQLPDRHPLERPDRRPAKTPRPATPTGPGDRRLGRRQTGDLGRPGQDGPVLGPGRRQADCDQSNQPALRCTALALSPDGKTLCRRRRRTDSSASSTPATARSVRRSRGTPGRRRRRLPARGRASRLVSVSADGTGASGRSPMAPCPGRRQARSEAGRARVDRPRAAQGPAPRRGRHARRQGHRHRGRRRDGPALGRRRRQAAAARSRPGTRGRSWPWPSAPTATLLATARPTRRRGSSRSRTAKLVRTLTGHAGPVQSVAFSPKGDRLATAGADGGIKVWETATGQGVIAFGHTAPGGAAIQPIQAVAFTADGGARLGLGRQDPQDLDVRGRLVRDEAARPARLPRPGPRLQPRRHAAGGRRRRAVAVGRGQDLGGRQGDARPVARRAPLRHRLRPPVQPRRHEARLRPRPTSSSR